MILEVGYAGSGGKLHAVTDIIDSPIVRALCGQLVRRTDAFWPPTDRRLVCGTCNRLADAP
jgi:hypothetical protein